MDLQKAIKTRHSVHKFKDKKPDWRDILGCIDAARFAPMAGGNHSLKFILVDDPESIKQIALACQQDFVGTASYIVVAFSSPERTMNAYGKEGETYLRQQAGAGIQNFLLAIEDHGLASCWVGYFVEDQVKRQLGIPEAMKVEAVLPVGYEYEKKKTRKAKIDLDRILYFNKYGQTKMHPEKKMNV